MKTELSFSEMFEMLTFRNHEKYGPLLQKTQNNDLVVSRVKFLHLVLLNICRFEVILCADVYELRVYFDALSRDQIHLDKLLRRQWSK